MNTYKQVLTWEQQRENIYEKGVHYYWQTDMYNFFVHVYSGRWGSVGLVTISQKAISKFLGSHSFSWQAHNKSLPYE